MTTMDLPRRETIVIDGCGHVAADPEVAGRIASRVCALSRALGGPVFGVMGMHLRRSTLAVDIALPDADDSEPALMAEERSTMSRVREALRSIVVQENRAWWERLRAEPVT